MQSRALATDILYRLCTDSVSLDQQFEKRIHEAGDRREQSFVRDLCLGTMRWYPQLDYYLQQLLTKPIKKKNLRLTLLCWLGLYQIVHQRTSDHGAVSATVAACNELSLEWARGMVNAVLRNFIRNREQILDQANRNEAARYAHPQWLIDMIKGDWPDDWQSVLEANNQPPPMTLRVNRRRITREKYRDMLQQNGLTSQNLPHCASGLLLERACDVHDLPGFAEGLVSLQDGAAQLAAALLDLLPGQRVLDACAAPGGKTCHILEQQPDLAEVLALDRKTERLDKIRQNMERLRLDARLLPADASETGIWWDSKQFDRILVDAPCSATGVIRRHPDIKYLRRVSDIDKTVSVQTRLLRSLWPLLTPGGKLLYATCSILKRENDSILSDFLHHTKEARVDTITHCPGEKTGFGYQILPGQFHFDGFYYARLQKP